MDYHKIYRTLDYFKVTPKMVVDALYEIEQTRSTSFRYTPDSVKNTAETVATRFAGYGSGRNWDLFYAIKSLTCSEIRKRRNRKGSKKKFTVYETHEHRLNRIYNYKPEQTELF